MFTGNLFNLCSLFMVPSRGHCFEWDGPCNGTVVLSNCFHMSGFTILFGRNDSMPLLKKIVQCASAQHNQAIFFFRKIFLFLRAISESILSFFGPYFF